MRRGVCSSPRAFRSPSLGGWAHARASGVGSGSVRPPAGRVCRLGPLDDRGRCLGGASPAGDPRLRVASSGGTFCARCTRGSSRCGTGGRSGSTTRRTGWRRFRSRSCSTTNAARPRLRRRRRPSAGAGAAERRRPGPGLPLGQVPLPRRPAAAPRPDLAGAWPFASWPVFCQLMGDRSSVFSAIS